VTTPGDPLTTPRPFATVAPPPAAGLMVAYLTPLLAPTPVATRLPQPAKTEDTINGFLRVEVAGGGPDVEQLLFTTSVILHSYCTNNDESRGEQLMAEALAWAGNAQGTYVTHRSTEADWYVTYSRITALGMKHADPQVAMTRFRGMVTWVVQGRALEPRSPIQPR
jgi:hypothetical protein